MSEVISHTPIWVFIVFFVLVVLGLQQSKQRVVKLKTVVILPVAMFIFSFFGVYSVFGLTLLSLGLWATGLVVAVILGLKLAYPKSVSYSAQDKQLTVPGSWVPLMLMMAIFMTKYAVGFAVARQLPFVNGMIFMLLISVMYGLFSGVFIARSVVMFKVSKNDD